MSKELDNIIESCSKRMDFLNTQASLQGCDFELNSKLWWEAYERHGAALSASRELRKMKYTTAGDFSHLQSTPGVRF